MLFCTYDPEAPSFRHRLAPLIPLLEARHWRCAVWQVPRGRYGLRFLEERSSVAAADLVLLAKLRLGMGEGLLMRRLARRVVFDFDDALFLSQPKADDDVAKQSWLRRRKFDLTCRTSDLVIAGNDYLAAAAGRWGRRVEVLPTPVDLAAYPRQAPADRRTRTLVWIGRPENLRYLRTLRPILADLAGRFPDMRLRIICSRFPDWDDVPIERIEWSESSEVRHLASCGIGIMPLTDDGWARGKCAFKLLQYMAAGLASVASPVGMNREVVVDGTNGLLAGEPDEWRGALEQLLSAPERCLALGRAGRELVAERYDRRLVAPRAAALLESVAAPTRGAETTGHLGAASY
ncbi:MAG: glycosyltransferase family 4 protein [Thermoanaerobaculia bacterium]|nr:glycosyltransferase family 4 protein [Thermoanaerobaculia bacterium]